MSVHRKAPTRSTSLKFCIELQGEEFIKINSFNRKKRFIKCTADFKQLVWTSAKNHKRSTNKGSVLTAELRSVAPGEWIRRRNREVAAAHSFRSRVPLPPVGPPAPLRGSVARDSTRH